ncbi:MAG: phosphate ABC transporter substrate-binding protein [Desulfobulbaceae bacterium]
MLVVLLLSVPFAGFAADRLAYQGTHILTYETMAKLASAFAEETGVALTVKGGGCADGVVVVESGRFEMGGLCCPLKSSEEVKGLVAHPVARDIKVVIVNRANPLRNLTSSQVRKIHQGKITNWKEVGWIDKPVAVIYRKHCLDREEPVRSFLGLDDALGNLAPRAIVVRTDKELIDYVGQFPTAIGITSRVFARAKKVSILSIDSVAPTVDNAESGRYPVTGTLFIVTKGEPDKRTRRFLDFVRSDRGREIIRENLATVP